MSTLSLGYFRNMFLSMLLLCSLLWKIGFLQGNDCSKWAIKVRCNVVSAMAVWRLVIIFSLIVVLASEFENSACSGVELSSLLLYGMILCSLAVKVRERNLCFFLLCRLVFWVVVYNLWHTRNELRHAGSPSTEEQILKKVMWEVRTRLARSENFPKTRENISLSSLWNLPSEMLV